MWKIGVIVVAVLLEITSADVKIGVSHELVQRFKRSPQYYDCGPPPPPPPPPFWPPPPPPPYWGHRQQPQPQYQYSNAESSAISQGNANAGGGASASSGASASGSANAGRGDIAGGTNGGVQPCSTCGEHGSNAVSNARSETGQAIAVAVARASAN